MKPSILVCKKGGGEFSAMAIKTFSLKLEFFHHPSAVLDLNLGQISKLKNLNKISKLHALGLRFLKLFFCNHMLDMVEGPYNRIF
jgi:hypothetical protein